jgi:hypothetical protein
MALAAQAYQIKVTLQYSKPPIWRRLLVSPDTRLDELHVILQVAMPWANSHLHSFMQRFKRRDPTRQEQNAMMTGKGPVDWDAIRGVRVFSDPDFELDEVNDESKARLDQILLQPKDKLFYEYDFGDGWQHEIMLEKVVPVEAGDRLPRCVAGRLNCPPDDSGGLYGYYEMLEALKDPDHEGHEDAVEWLGDFDPAHFDPAEVNDGLAEVFGK